MNKLIILPIIIVFFGLIATHALAQNNINDLSASEFFYGELADNNNPVINTSNLRVVRGAASPENLAASDFFYSQPIEVQPEIVIGPEIVINDDRPQRTEVAATLADMITPEIFYGYTDVIVNPEAPCANC